MQTLEAAALTASRTTLVLDTRAGDPSQTLYTKLGYETCGLIPQYARSAEGDLLTTVFMVKLLNPAT